MSWNEENIPKYLDKAIQSSSPLIREELGHVLRIMQKTPTTANLVAKYCLQRVESAETIDERLNMAGTSPTRESLTQKSSTISLSGTRASGFSSQPSSRC